LLGTLRATHGFAAHIPAIKESMVRDTLAGGLSGLSGFAGLARNATIVAERPVVQWRALRQLAAERSELARAFTALVLNDVAASTSTLLCSRKSGFWSFTLNCCDKVMIDNMYKARLDYYRRTV
jgi:hypothetical protein